jgi:hypothetical protein
MGIRSRQRVVIGFTTVQGSSSMEMHRCLKKVYGEDAKVDGSVRCWAHRFNPLMPKDS